MDPARREPRARGPGLDEATLDRLRRFARGELTWAEVEGWTWEHAQVLAQVGCGLASEGRLAEAAIVFEGMVELNPRDAAARAALGTVYQKLGRREDALAQYDAALALDASHPVALSNRGELRLRAGDPAGADDLLEAARADPGGDTHGGRRALGILRAISAKLSHGAASA